jgi:Relaxase/Mobilisation nuclease domain
MPKRTADLAAHPLLDLTSYARRGPGRTDRLGAGEIEHIALTVRRAPEVMIKVLARGTQDLRSVQRHLAYIDRSGEVELETDDGEHLTGKGIEEELLENWDLDLDVHRRRSELEAANGRDPPKLVHKLMFSMPVGTPPDKLLAAVRTFAREEFGLKHRYAMALHTDEPHPHVHMVVKALSEHGVRLHIRKATLREWRCEFARHLREQGVEANATERAVRGESRTSKRDGIYRATLRGESTYMRRRVQTAVQELAAGGLREESSRRTLLGTRSVVLTGWEAVAGVLGKQQPDLALMVRRFARSMPMPQPDKEIMSDGVAQHMRVQNLRERSRSDPGIVR